MISGGPEEEMTSETSWLSGANLGYANPYVFLPDSLTYAYVQHYSLNLPIYI